MKLDNLSQIDSMNTFEVGSFVQQLAREFFVDGPDRRSEPRYHVTIPVTVQPMDDNHNLVGRPCRAVTRDLSESGIGLITQDPLNGKLLIQLSSPSGQELRAIAQILRCKPNGYYFDVGCKFVDKD